MPLDSAPRSPRWMTIASGTTSRMLLWAFACLLAQQYNVPYRLDVMGLAQPSASLIHLHAGLLLLIALCEPQRRMLAFASVVLLFGWLVRAWAFDYRPLWLITGVAVTVFGYFWTRLCAHWMGWPRPVERRRFRLSGLFRFTTIGLILYPAGIAASVVLTNMMYVDLPRQVDVLGQTALQVALAKHFGVAVITFPALLAWCEWNAPAPGPWRIRWTLPAILGLAALASIVATRYARDAFPSNPGQLLMDYRFGVFAVLAWCVLRLPPRHSMPLLSVAMLGLVSGISLTAEKVANLIGAVNLLHIALECSVLLVAMLYLRLASRDWWALTAQLDGETRRDAMTALPNLKALRDRLAPSPADPLDRQLGFLLLDHTDDLVPGFGLHMQAKVMSEVGAALGEDVEPFLVGTGHFALIPHREPVHADFWSRLVARVEQAEIQIDGERFRLMPYVGVAQYAGAGAAAINDALLRASQLAFEARGRNEVQPLFDLPQTAPDRHRGHRQQIDDAGFALACLRSGRIEAYFQPIRRLDDGSAFRADGPLIGEILCRMRDEQGGLVTPDRFLKPIEAMGRGAELDLAVIQTVFRTLRAQPGSGARCQRLSINLTGQSLASKGFESRLRSLLDEAPLPLSSLCFEITETAAIASPFQARALLDDLRSLGCLIAIDDFGAGMQSFSRLKEMPVDIIKIDGSFVVRMAERGQDYALVKACVSVAQAFNADTVAEFVENEETAAVLAELGVDWIQGYLHSRPLPFSPLLESGTTSGIDTQLPARNGGTAMH